jgi:hypothetical protein
VISAVAQAAAFAGLVARRESPNGTENQICGQNQRLRAEELPREWRPERERALAGAQFLARPGRGTHFAHY